MNDALLLNLKKDSLPLFYGRRKGRAFSAHQEALLANVLPKLLWTKETFFPPQSPVWLEIGFGKGDHLIQRLRSWPDAHFLGVEAFLPGIVSVLSRLSAEEQHRLRLFPDNVHLLISQLKPQSLEGIFLLFPDPWPKKHHHKRRLLQTEFLSFCHTALKAGGTFWVATDDKPVAEWMKEQLSVQFICIEESEKAEDWPLTAYGRKAHALGKSCTYMIWRKK